MPIKQYEDLAAKIPLKIREQDAKRVDAYLKRANATRFGAIAVIVVAVVLLLFANNAPAGIAVASAALFLSFLYRMIRRSFKKEVFSTLLDECNAAQSLSLHCALASRTKKQTAWPLKLYNIGLSLYYAGRFDEAQKIVDMMRANDTEGRYRMPIARLASLIHYVRKDLASLDACGDEALALVDPGNNDTQPRETLTESVGNLILGVNAKDRQTAMAAGIAAVRIVAHLERDGQWQTIFDACSSTVDNAPLLLRVIDAYHACIAAHHLGDTQHEQEFKDFVIEHGGDLWYVSALTAEDATK